MLTGRVAAMDNGRAGTGTALGHLNKPLEMTRPWALGAEKLGQTPKTQAARPKDTKTPSPPTPDHDAPPRITS